jgi:hypothetical protein
MPRQHQIISDLDIFKVSCPTFVTDVAIDDYEYDEDPVEVGCHFEKDEECSLRSCHQKHKKGFIVRTRCGKFFNIGQDCGGRYSASGWMIGKKALRPV